MRAYRAVEVRLLNSALDENDWSSCDFSCFAQWEKGAGIDWREN